jgi:hypothetical protein
LIHAAGQRTDVKRCTISVGAEQLDCFFPFDPFLLKNSSSFITPLYNQWQSMRDENDATDESSSDEEEDSTTYTTDEESETSGSLVSDPFR